MLNEGRAGREEQNMEATCARLELDADADALTNSWACTRRPPHAGASSGDRREHFPSPRPGSPPRVNSTARCVRVEVSHRVRVRPSKRLPLLQRPPCIMAMIMMIKMMMMHV